MNSRASAPDHRWGPRSTLKRVIDIHTPGGMRSHGVVESASISGAYISTSARLPPFIRLTLGIPGTNTRWEAFVARIDDGGVDVEWLEPEPAIVQHMLNSAAPESSITTNSIRD
jgi:hypothetical protein